MKNGVNWGDYFAIGDANTKNCTFNVICKILDSCQLSDKCFLIINHETYLSIYDKKSSWKGIMQWKLNLKSDAIVP